jgi:hypothetical protein
MAHSPHKGVGAPRRACPDLRHGWLPGRAARGCLCYTRPQLITALAAAGLAGFGGWGSPAAGWRARCPLHSAFDRLGPLAPACHRVSEIQLGRVDRPQMPVATNQ